MIHITDSLTDRILDDISEDLFWNDKHYKSLNDKLETFDFTTFADKRFSEHLTKRNRIIIPDEDGKYVEFIIENTRKYRSPQSGLFIEVYTSASYIELAKSKVINPQTTPTWTSKQHVDFALAGTGWEAGELHFAGALALTIEKHTNPFSYLKRLANEFNLELHFRVEVDGNKVVRRYVDLLERVGVWRGREVEFGKDLIGIERKENMANIVTALVGLGPERQDGTRLEVFIEDKDALARWGRNGQHLVEVYEPQSTDQDIAIERLTELTENELQKRINSIVEYQADIADLEKVPGLEHERIRFGDTIKIKDTAFNPPLYLEARVHTQERSIKKDGTKKVTLGDYIEHKEEDVLAIWRSLQSEIARKVSMSDVTDVVYTKPEVDDKDASVYQNSTYYSDNVSETKKQEAIIIAADDATNKANTAENNAKVHADMVAEQKKQEAIQAAISDAEAKVNQAKSDLEADIALKADATWVNGQLVTKADKADTYTKTEVDNALNLKVSLTTYTIDKDGIVTQLDNHESRITQTENEILTKVSNTTYQQEKTELESGISLLETRMSTAESSILQNANQIGTKVSRTEFDNLKIGGRNLIHNSGQFKDLTGWSSNGTESSIKLVTKDGKSVIEGVKSIMGSNVYGIKKNTQYIYTVKIMFDSDVNFSGDPLHCHISVTGNVHGGKQSVVPINSGTLAANEWHIISVIITTNNLIEPSSYFKPFIYKSTELDGVTFWVEWFKFEEGNKPTDWSPAPEDTEEELNGLYTRVTSTESTINQLSSEIELKVSQSQYDSDLNSLGSRITTAESTITQLVDEIDLRVEKNGIISAINQTAEQVKIQASRIEFDGHVFGENATFTGHLDGASGSFSGNLSAADVIAGNGDRFGSLNFDVAFNDGFFGYPAFQAGAYGSGTSRSIECDIGVKQNIDDRGAMLTNFNRLHIYADNTFYYGDVNIHGDVSADNLIYGNEERIQTGSASFQVSNVSTYGANITFPIAFTQNPKVIAAIEDVVGGRAWFVYRVVTTPTGASVYCSERDNIPSTGTLKISWIAVGK